jgi:oxalate decarboxylase/phosphoglucose isomerase-like protein (cupin superfamily)
VHPKETGHKQTTLSKIRQLTPNRSKPGLGPDEAHFILGFDDGHFSEFGTFSITDWVGHTPPNVLSQNLGLPESVFATFPKKEVYIVQGKVPPAEPEPFRTTNLQTNQSPHKYRLNASPAIEFPGGELRIVSQKEFPILNSLTGATMLLKPGAPREMHWHPNRRRAIIRITIANIITTIIRTGTGTGAITVIGTTTMTMIKPKRF